MVSLREYARSAARSSLRCFHFALLPNKMLQQPLATEAVPRAVGAWVEESSFSDTALNEISSGNSVWPELWCALSAREYPTTVRALGLGSTAQYWRWILEPILYGFR